MEGEASFALKHTNVSRPQLAHTESKQSITASEDYYSLSGSSQGSDGGQSQRTVVRYATPPSQLRTPAQSHERVHQSTSSLAVIPARTQTPGDQLRVPVQEQFSSSPAASQHTQQRQSPTPVVAVEPPSSSEPSRHTPMDPRTQMTTPGVDDTPYIRFAIDQLTRDEEVRGSRRYHQGAHSDDYPVDRIIPDEGLGYVSHAPETKEKHGMPREMSPPPPPPQPPIIPSESPVEREVFMPFYPPASSYQYPALNFLPGILRPLWLGVFISLCLLMLIILLVAAVGSLTGDGIWAYGTFGDNRYFTFEYLPILLGMIILLWLLQVEAAILRIMPFKCLASTSVRSRAEAPFLDLTITHFLLPNLQYFRASQPLIGVAFLTFWLFNFSVPLLSGVFNVHYFSSSGWRWVATDAIIWTVIALYILLIAGLCLVAATFWGKDTGLKWDPRSLADIIVLLARSNNLTAWTGSETFASSGQFVNRLVNRADRLGYWKTSKRPKDVFYGIGEEGASTRRYSVEQGRIREKAPERVFADPSGDVERGGGNADPYVRTDLRSRRVRARFLPWFLRDTYVVAWVVTAFFLLVAFLIVSFVNNIALRGFAPGVGTTVNDAGFSPSNTLFSLLPSFFGLLLFLSWTTVDVTVRRLAPYAALSQSTQGSTAEHSLLVDYAARHPLSATIAAASNGHYLAAATSLLTLTAAVLPVLAGGVFWTQYYPDRRDGLAAVRVAAEPTGFYALAFFLALHALGYALLAVPPTSRARARAALPVDASRSLAPALALLYQSNLLADPAFHAPATRAELVARLLGPAALLGTTTDTTDVAATGTTNTLRGWRSWERLRGYATAGPHAPGSTERVAGPAGLSAAEAEVLHRQGVRASRVVEDGVRYGFGVFVGRDGREHLGVDRVERAGRRMEGY